MTPVEIDFRWTDSRGGRWLVTTIWAEVDGRAEPVEIRLRSVGKPRPVTTTTLRELNLGSRLERLRKRKASRLRSEPSVPEVNRSHVSPTSLPPEHYREVALLYAKAWGRGKPPTRTVAEDYGVGYSTAGWWIRTAREMGFLEPVKQGQAGGVRRKGRN